MRATVRRVSRHLILSLVLLLAAFAPTMPPTTSTDAPPARATTPKVVVAAVASPIDGFAPINLSPSAGSMVNWIELHSNGLVTSDVQARPIPRLARELPSLDTGSIKLLGDGRMVTTWALRTDVTWHDGAPFTAQDVAFGFRVHGNTQVPFNDRTAVSRIESVEVVDPATVDITWKGPFYLGGTLGVGILFPLPAHILESEYAAGDLQRFQNLAYWTDQYVHTGPFRLIRYERGSEAAFQAHEGYFLGRPRIDTVVIREMLDRNAIFAAMLSGDVHATVQLFDAEMANNLRDRWDTSDGGKVISTEGGATFLALQFNPARVRSQELLDPRVRRGLYLALDRAALADLVYAGRLTSGGEARSLFPTSDPLYLHVRDGFATLANDPPRAAQAFAEADLTRGPDGMLVNARGERVEVNVSTVRDSWGAATVDMWKSAGIDATMVPIPPALRANREHLTSYPGAALIGSGSGDRILGQIDGDDIAHEQNAYAGLNRGSYHHPRVTELIRMYRNSIRESERGAAVRQISELVAQELPVLNIAFSPVFATVNRQVQAFDDLSGGYTNLGAYFGSYTRDSHLWQRA